MGDIYGRGDPDFERAGQTHGVYPLGKAGAEQEGDADESEAPDPGSAAPKPAVRLPRLLRKQALQQDEQISEGKRPGAHRLAD